MELLGLQLTQRSALGERDKEMPRTATVTEKPVVWEARQVADDRDSDWVLVNSFNTQDVRVVSNEEYKARYTRSRATVEHVPATPAIQSDQPPLVPQTNPELTTDLNPPVEDDNS